MKLIFSIFFVVKIDYHDYIERRISNGFSGVALPYTMFNLINALTLTHWKLKLSNLNAIYRDDLLKKTLQSRLDGMINLNRFPVSYMKRDLLINTVLYLLRNHRF